MKRIKLHKNGEEDYWKSFTDIMAGLLLIVILLMALLFLYLTQMTPDPDVGPGIASADTPTHPAHATYHYPSVPQHSTDYHDREEERNHGGGGSTTTTTMPQTIPTEGEGEEAKAAVFITVVDEETGNAIKEEGITFELYKDIKRRGGLKKLSTYYPEKIEYSNYETTENGTFFLPEKIPYGTYSLHNLTAPESYGAGEDVDFEIKEAHDWPEPFMLKVPLAPAKNIIRVQTKDSVTGAAVPGYVYEVIADEDIVTLDGTLRYEENQIVDEFTCDQKGYGESIKLYLGSYRIRQKAAPEYYAVSEEPIAVDVGAKDDVDVPVKHVSCDKTALVVELKDEYTDEAIAGAVYTLKNGAEITTAANGMAVLTDLTKGTSYELSLKSLPDKYRTKEEPIVFHVDESGRINGEPRYIAEQKAYMTRLSVAVKDVLLGYNLSGENVTVFDSDGEVVAQTDTGGSAEIITGLEPGEYTVQSGEAKHTKVTVHLEDKAKPTNANVLIWTYVDFALIFIAVLLLAAAIVVTIVIVKRKRMNKTNAQRKTKGKNR